MIPIVKQEGIKDCGVSCMLSIIKYYKGNINIEYLKEMTNTTRHGVTFLGMKKAFIELGFSSTGVDVEDIYLLENLTPSISQIKVNNKFYHFVVIYKINKNKNKITIMDPAYGIKVLKLDEFLKMWTNKVLIIKKQKEIPNFIQSNKVINIIREVLLTNKLVILNIFLLSMISTIFAIINSYYFRIIIDDILITNNINNLSKLVIIFIIMMIIKSLSSIYKEQISLYLSKKIDYFLITNVYNHILLLPYTYFKNKSTGEIISRINDLSYVRNILIKLILTCLIDITLIIVTSLILINISYLLFLFSLITLLLYLIITIICSSIFKKYINDNQEKSAEVNSFLVESFNSYDSIKGTNSELKQINKFKNKYKDLLESIFRFNNFYCLYNNIKETINNLMIIILIGIGTKLVMDEIITLGELITFNSLIIYYYEPIKNILALEPDIKSAINSIKRINTILNVEVEKRNFTEYKLIDGNIKFNNLNYSYDGYNKTLNNISFEILKGEKVLINGESGIGKSTLLKLLLKYYNVKKSNIFIDDIDINDYSIDSIRNSISYISQSELLNNDTIYNNISYHNDYNIKKFNLACGIAQVDKLMCVKNQGYDFFIEENGFNLSGGERQRIILARHILLNKNILIIDEGTSAIDNNLERKIIKSLFKLYDNKTIIHISHHTNNIDLYDKVLTINKENKELIERVSYGTYN